MAKHADKVVAMNINSNSIHNGEHGRENVNKCKRYIMCPFYYLMRLFPVLVWVSSVSAFQLNSYNHGSIQQDNGFSNIRWEAAIHRNSIKLLQQSTVYNRYDATILFGSNSGNHGRGYHHHHQNPVSSSLKASVPSFVSLQQKQKIHLQTVRNKGEWIPRHLADDDIFGSDKEENLEKRAVELAAQLVRERLKQQKESNNNNNNDSLLTATTGTQQQVESDEDDPLGIASLVKGRFIDLTCEEKGEKILENIFLSASVRPIISQYTKDEIRGAVMVLQSLCVMGTQVGVKGPPEQLKRMVAHLQDDRVNDPAYVQRDLYETWDHDSVRRLKFRLDRNPAIELLAALSRRRINQGAFDLLVDLGVWSKHEDLALLRSGFPLRFTAEEERIATIAATEQHTIPDTDTILGIRQDLRHLKVYTIDGESTSEIDDGLSIEKLPSSKDGTNRYRIWAHIADADRWAPRNSSLLEIARRRITSLYLPRRTIPMFPSIVSQHLMSLKANTDVCALSLGVELNDDGSIDLSSIIVTPSLINVNYRLTYDDVDEMMDEGIAYSEEWELGALLDAAKQRRIYRIKNGSAEGAVPNPIPYSSISLIPDITEPDQIRIKVNIQVSHNAAKNKTAVAEDRSDGNSVSSEKSLLSVLEDPLSSAYLLVTEAMILAGEAIGLWKTRIDQEEKLLEFSSKFKNQLRLPFRTQAPPDYNARSRERNMLTALLEENVGNGLCHAWYARRFLQSVRVQEEQMSHSGLGLQSYVQWSSPIRRFSDLQVHASVKRYLRRKRIYELLYKSDGAIPTGIRPVDLGISSNIFSYDDNNQLVLTKDSIDVSDLDQDLNFFDGIGLMGAGKNLQRQSQQYWLMEYVRRMKEFYDNPDRIYTACILGCIDPERQQYAIYVYELGFEHRYISPIGRLDPGTVIQLKVDIVNPRAGLLNFVRVV